MLQIVVPPYNEESWDEVNERFVNRKFPGQTIVLEHSLVSMSKWESKYHKPFLSKDKKTDEELIYYIKCMTITQNPNPDTYKYLTLQNLKEINEYIEDSHTATWFSKQPVGGGSNEIVTSELIYYWMIALEIPFECQRWHLNRLLTLVRICNVKNQKEKKMPSKQVSSNNAALNAARRAKMHSKG